MTVLNTIELTKTAPIVCTIGVLCVFLAVVSYIVTVLIPLKYEKLCITCIVVLIFSTIGAFVCGAISDEVTVPNGEVRYEVLISDDISFAEVIEKYDIIEQRGEIFVVEEKE